MKICLVHRYFWPDMAPYGVLLHHIASGLADSGHDVKVLTSQPSYKDLHNRGLQPWKEETNGFIIKRLKLPHENRSSKLSRLIGMLMFSTMLFTNLFKEKCDLIMVSTVPQVIGGFTVRIYAALTKTPFIYHCQDIHPEIALSSGILSNRFIYKLLQKIDTSTCNAALYTIVLSEDMKNTLLGRGCKSENLLVINNFELSIPDNSEKAIFPPYNLIRSCKFRLLFAGNIGKFQNLETIIKIAHKLSHINDIEFVFIGDGAAVDSLKQQAGDLLGKTVYFYGQQPISIARQLIADAQLSIVSLSGDIYKYAYPSKTMTYLSENSPLLVLIDKKSELAKIVEAHHLGIVSDHHDVDRAANKILYLYENVSELNEIKNFITSFYNEHFEKNSILSKWVNLFNQISLTHTQFSK